MKTSLVLIDIQNDYFDKGRMIKYEIVFCNLNQIIKPCWQGIFISC